MGMYVGLYAQNLVYVINHGIVVCLDSLGKYSGLRYQQQTKILLLLLVII